MAELTPDDVQLLMEQADTRKKTQAEQAAKNLPAVAPSLEGWTPPIPLPDDPADNPRWQSGSPEGATPNLIRKPQAAMTSLSSIREQMMAEVQRDGLTSAASGASLDRLDEWMFQLRVRGLSHDAIAAELGGGWTGEQVRLRLMRTYNKIEETTTAEHKALQWARLELAMNALIQSVEMGDLDAIDLWIKAIERGNKMAQLEQEKLSVEIRVVNEQSARIMLQIADMVVDKLKPYMRGVEPEIIEGVVDEVFDEVEGVVNQASKPIPYDPRTGEILQ